MDNVWGGRECVSDVFALFLRVSLPLKKILTNRSEAKGGGALTAYEGSIQHSVLRGVL